MGLTWYKRVKFGPFILVWSKTHWLIPKVTFVLFGGK